MAGDVPSPLCLQRIKKDIKSIHDHPLPGIFIHVGEQDIRVIHALIVGPRDTPYHGGFFYFLLKVPFNYPIKPPEAKLMTTGQGRVRFNPNLYSCGKVCLSILGTFPGPAWSAAQRLSSVLLSIQSLMNEKPFFNEPGMTENRTGDSDRYNRIIQHETLRVAVCDMLDGNTADTKNMPQSLKDIMERQFLEFYGHYLSLAQSRSTLNGSTWTDPMLFGNKTGNFNYASILKRLQNIKTRLEAKQGQERNSKKQF